MQAFGQLTSSVRSKWADGYSGKGMSGYDGIGNRDSGRRETEK
jgi:hypothetical protein